MTEEIKAIIEKNLPAQVGEILKTTLEQAKRDSERVKQLENENMDMRTERYSLKETINSYKSFDERNSKLNERELVVAEAERDRKVFEAELKLKESEKRITDNTNFVGMVLKSPIFKKTIFENENGFTTWNNTTNRDEFCPSGGKTITEEKHVD